MSVLSKGVAFVRRSNSWWRVVPIGVVVLVAGVITVVQLRSPEPFRPRFGADGLVTNELLERHADVPHVRRSDDWLVTSGSLFAVSGMGYSGKPDDVRPDARSARTTDSAVLRVITRRQDFADVRVRLMLRLDRFVSTSRTPAQDYDGVHLFLRYRNSRQLYAISMQRRDGKVAIKRKDAGGPSNGGRYTELAEAEFPWQHDWVSVEARIRDADDGTTRVALRLDGRQIVSATDSSPQRLRGAGAIGLRGDNAEFYFKDLVAENIG